MADTIKLATSITYTEPDLNRTSRFLDETNSHVPLSYNHGEANIPGDTQDHELVSNVNMCCLFSDQPIGIKVGDTTASEMTNMTAFTYDGDTTTIFISNQGTDAAKVKFVSAKY